MNAPDHTPSPSRAEIRLDSVGIRGGLPRLALSPAEAAASLGVSVDYLDEHIAHELRWVRRGRRKFVSVRELEAWLDRASEVTL